ncbi:MAG: DUF3795 domain-containing protein [Bacteroidales bacterium]|nr:DUF3795 domain-containing protein [Bacteroidales bacterium]
MKQIQTRREFLIKGCRLGLACGALAFCPKLNLPGKDPGEEIPDPKKRNYCGYICPDDCPLYVATIEDSPERKKEAYTMFEIEERHGVAFDPEQIICYGCKADDEPQGIIVNRCKVRRCAIENGYDCCIECNNLPDCEFDLWERFPEFHKEMIDLQTKYTAARKKI